MEDLVIKSAVLDYFSGRATPLQKQAIKVWLQNPSNHEQYYQWLHDWETQHLQAAASWQSAFDRTIHKIDQDVSEQETPSSSTRVLSWRYNYFRRIAVAIFLVTLSGLLIYKKWDNVYYKTSKAVYGETKKITLPDGSRVALNANSSVRYPRFGFGIGARRVELNGEADFEIERTPDQKQFIVSTSTGLEVVVLGTQFTVFARPRGSQVTLRTGKVALQMHKSPKSPPIVMSPGDVVAIDTDGKLSRSHTSKPEHYSSWKEYMITLDRTSLKEIAAMLEETYGFQVELKDLELGSRTATGSLPVKNAETTLELIADMFDINFFKQENRIIFKD